MGNHDSQKEVLADHGTQEEEMAQQNMQEVEAHVHVATVFTKGGNTTETGHM